MSAVLQYVLYLAILVAVGIPLGVLMGHGMDGKKWLLSPVVRPVEKGIYKVLRIDEMEQMNWKRYLAAVLEFSGIGLVFLIAL